MSSTEQQRVPLDDAFRTWTGREPPPPLTDEQQREFDARRRAVREQARQIYRELDADEAA
ncbi:MAG: hypothetical protein AUG44_20220 [Actinobacteria bacterium 13_1_20CM_3_71_11]|nr:MAG: hypothetical protein AUG44_20220 [Actinobacteria bacterium 13_1_20CM_3_71_11]